MKLPALHHVLGYVALLVLVGASSAEALPGTGTVDSGDIKNGEVKRIDVAGSAINSAKVANHSLTGIDIAESTLGSRFARTYTSLAGTPRTKVAQAGGLEVRAGCFEDGGIPFEHYADIRVRSTVNGAKLTMAKVNGTFSETTFTANFDAGDEVPVGGGFTAGHADLLYSTPAGKVVEAHIAWAGPENAGSDTCFMHGVVVG